MLTDIAWEGKRARIRNDSEVGSLSNNDTKAVPSQNGICRMGKDGLCAELELMAAHKMHDPKMVSHSEQLH